MSDRLENFESELADMRPRAATPEMLSRVEMQLAAQRRSDRMLIGAMGLGAAAACVIVTLLVGQSQIPVQAPPAIAVAPQTLRVGNEIQAFAGIGDPDLWK
ncbi:MAG TPA: hypothetical protein VL992_20825 [Tepidisphaeraceae bacterium]|nr:hypothetical protein [Tepidisphaeraceae bacterium]